VGNVASMVEAAEEPAAHSSSAARAPVSPWRLARTFALVGLCAFGGVMPWVYRAVVEKEKWLDEREFAEVWSVCMILPGATSTNVAATLGYRLGGLRGATGATVGLLTPPFVIVLIMAVLYKQYGALPAVHGAVRGVTAVAAGLVFATALKLAKSQPRKWVVAIFAVTACVAISIFHWPLMGVVGALVPISLIMEWRAVR